jgi:hypothetical protein
MHWKTLHRFFKNVCWPPLINDLEDKAPRAVRRLGYFTTSQQDASQTSAVVPSDQGNRWQLIAATLYWVMRQPNTDWKGFLTHESASKLIL